MTPIEWTLQRTLLDPKVTLGELHDEKEFVAFTLENPSRQKKIYGKTCIPSGRYAVEWAYSSAHGKFLPLLADVPFFTGVELHGGVGVSDTLGCPLLGYEKFQDPKSGIWYLRMTLQASGEVSRRVEHIRLDLKIPLYLTITGGYSASEMSFS